MIRSSTTFTSLAILAALTVAPQAVWAEAGNVVGGGGATITGGGGDIEIAYSTGGAGGGGVFAQPGRLAGFTGSHGNGQLVEYLTPAPAGAGRQVRLSGGGDDAQVVDARNR